MSACFVRIQSCFTFISYFACFSWVLLPDKTASFSHPEMYLFNFFNSILAFLFWLTTKTCKQPRPGGRSQVAAARTRVRFSFLANLNIFLLFFSCFLLSFLHTLQSLIIQLSMKNIFKYWRIFLFEFLLLAEWRKLWC